MGFDSFIEQYRIAGSDTTGELNEFRARLRLGYLHGRFLENHLQIEGQSLIGEQSVETTGRLNVHGRSGRNRLSLDNQWTYRAYRENTTYTFANDFIRYNGKAFFHHDFPGGMQLRLTDWLEIVDFDRHTDFDYDYVRNDVRLLGAYERDLTTTYGAAVGYRSKAVPDSTEIAYKAYTGMFEFRHLGGPNRQIYGSVNAERRIYAHKPTRSPYYSLYSDAIIRPVTWGKWGMSIDNVLESFVYDEPNDVFFSFLENRTAVRIMNYRSHFLSLGAGPTFGFLSSPGSSVDEYTEFGAKLTVDYAGGFWLSLSYEPGWRDYEAEGESSLDTIFSDFAYHRIVLFLSARMWGGVSLNVFGSFEPEDHTFDDDDVTASLLSVDLSYGFPSY